MVAALTRAVADNAHQAEADMVTRHAPQREEAREQAEARENALVGQSEMAI